MSSDESTYTLVEQFIATVDKQFRRLKRKRWITLGMVFFAVLLSGVLLSGFAEQFFFLSAGAKITIAVLLTLASTAAAIFSFQKLAFPSFKTFYQRFSKSHALPELSDALDLYYDDSDSKSGLHQAAIQQNVQSLQQNEVQARLRNFVQNRPSHKWYRSGLSALSGALLLIIAFTAWQPSAMNRLAHFWISYTPPNPYTYTIEPGTITLEQGESLIPKINFDGETPENLSLAFKTDIEEAYRQRSSTGITNNEASFAPIALTTSGQYYFVMDGFESDKYRISIQLRPRLERLSVTVTPPEYTRLDTSSYSYPFSQIRPYPGSDIQLSTVTNKPVKSFTLHRSALADSSIQNIDNPALRSYQHQWKVNQTDTVSFSMADSAGLSNKNAFRFVIAPRQDQSPFVNLVAPSENIKMKTPEDLRLAYEAGDDFGLTSASLQYELQRAFQSQPQSGSIELGRPAMSREEEYTWDIPELDPKPRDVITYWIEVTDNDAVSGYKTGRSQKMTITFPSTTEYMDELENQEENITESLDNISDSFERMEQEYNQFKEDLKKNPETNWEQKQQLNEVDKERQEIEKQVDELNKKFENIRKEIEKNQAVSPETMKAYEELQNLMKEINDPELQKALEELQNSLGQMSPDQMRKALENYEFNEELYKQRIERTKELFKSLKMNSDLDKMAQSLEELARQEQEISESQQSPAEDLKQQKAIQEDFNELEKKLEELGKNAPKSAEQQIQKLKKESRQQMNQTKQQLQENINQLQNQQQDSQSSPETRQQQQQIQKQMQQMAQQMQSAKQQMNQQRKQINSRALEYILYSLINLSTNQEELTKETNNLPPRSQAFVEKARKEQNISQQFTMLSDSLFQLSSEIPSFSNQINKKKVEVEDQLSRSVSMLSERDKSNSTYAQRQSLGGINELSTMIASLLDQMQNQQGGSGGGMSMQQMIEQIQKMSGQQQKLNQQIQQMINDMQGDRLSRDQMERLNQMSKQQNRIRKQLRELQQSGELESGDRVLSELERMSDQMEDAINDLRGGQLDQQLMQRQQNILSRMLSAEKAVQERGKKDEREGTAAEDQQQSTPPDITLEELQQRIRKMLNNPNRTKFTEDYQRLIEQYFELLKKQEKEVIQ